MISTSDRVLVLAILLVLAVSSVAYGTEVPLSFIGTYQGESHACMPSIIVLRKENISWGECKSKNVPYTVVEADEQHVFLELHSSDCRLPFIRLEGSKLDDANSVQDGLRVSGFRTRSEALSDNYGLDCHCFRVDPALAEDQTENFLHGKSATEREKALDIINQQIYSEKDKYNEIGLQDPSPAVRTKAASFLRGYSDHSVPLLIKAMAHDPDPKVRASAAGSLADFYRDIDYSSDSASDEDNPSGGDNDSGGAPSITPLEENLDDLLIGLKRLATLHSVVEILGGDDYGDSVVCRMSAKNQEKTLNALKHQLETVQLVKEVSRALHSGEPGYIEWSKAGEDIPRAIEKISKCHLTTQSTPPLDTASAPDDLKEEQRKRPTAEHRAKVCEFADLVLPESYAILAAGGYSGRKIDFQIDQSGHQATQMDVTVNYSSKPVVLTLGAYGPTIWNIKWTAATRIIAVLVSGYYRQVVAGIDPGILVLNSTSDNNGPCGYFYVGDRENPEKLNKMSRSLFGRPVDLVYLSKNGDILIGEPVPSGEKLIASESNPPESFHDKTAPIAGTAGLEDAVGKGLLRKATEADFDAWVDAVMANMPDRDVPSIAGKGRPKPPRPGTYDAYVVLGPFTYPPGVHGGNFFIPEGVPRPKGDPGHSFVHDFNNLKAYKKALEKLQDDQEGLTEDQSKETCEFAGLALPESIAVFAAGNYSGRKTDFQIDQSGHQATQMDVTVNYSSKPVVLMLGAYEPTVWNIKWTSATRIAAVFVSGYHRQAIAGLDATVPLKQNSSYDNKGRCRDAIVGERERELALLNPMSRRLFGRPVDLVYLAKNGEVVVGDTVPVGEKLITSESNPPESFYDKTALIAGLAGLEEAVQKGLLRKATGADVEAWVNAEIANAPKRDVPPIAGEDQSKPGRPRTYRAYVVLKPFTYPAGLWENRATFFIPKGVPRPQGTPGHSDVYDFNKFKIDVKPSIPEDAYYVRSKKARGSGKYYFEVTVDHGNIKQYLEADLEIGVKGGGKLIATDYRIGPQDLVIHTGGGGSVTIVEGNLGAETRLTKVVIGVAVDLDSRRFFCHRDGNWMGEPPGHESGTALPSGDEFYAEITSSVSMPPLLESNIVSLNFGEQPFAYPSPIGYVAFDADSSSSGKSSTDVAAFTAFSLVDPGTPIAGLPLSVWIQRYWQWMKSFPPGESPTDDTTGARCNAGQAGEVFFLAGTDQKDGQITRTCLVPKGKFVFIPYMNALVMKVSPQGTATCDSLVRQARSIAKDAADLSVTINGKNIASLPSFKGESGCFELRDASTHSTCPAAVAGYWLVLNPLATGHHEIQFSGRFKGTRFVKSVKYDLRVE